MTWGLGPCKIPLRIVKKLLFCLFYLLVVFICPVLLAGFSEQAPLIFKAHVQDAYLWSEEEERYHLTSSQFDFKLTELSPERDSSASSKVVAQSSVEAKTKADNIRYLSVISPKQVAFASSGAEQKHVQARLSDDKESLVVYFSTKDKFAILNGLLTVAPADSEIQNLLASTDKKQGMVSNYSCRVLPPNKLLCAMNYYLSQLVLPSSKKTAVQDGLVNKPKYSRDKG